MNFTCIGFDVRKWPWQSNFNVDETGWEQNENAYIDLIDKFDLRENEYQLLEIATQKQLSNITRYLFTKEDCNLMAIEFPHDVVKLQDEKYGFKTHSNNIDLSGFIFRGFDVCDFNGLFSALHNRRFGRNTSELFSKSELIKALEFTQIVNVFEREHFPNVVAKVYSLK